MAGRSPQRCVNSAGVEARVFERGGVEALELIVGFGAVFHRLGLLAERIAREPMAPDPALPAPKSEHGRPVRRDGPQRSEGIADSREGTPGKVAEEQPPNSGRVSPARSLRFSCPMDSRRGSEPA